MSLDWQNLKDNREEVLKAEIGSLLFLIEKTFLSWWKDNGYFDSETPLYSQRNQEIQNILENSFKNIEINVSKLMTNYNQSQNNINLWQHFFKDWRRWRRPNPNQINSQLKILQKLYGTAEALNSGIEKGSPKDNIECDYPFISNSFGTFKELAIPDKFDIARDNYKNQIITSLDKIANGNFNFNNDRKIFLTLIKKIYSHLPSDTRFPLNDVDLWNQSYMATSMFKALLAGVYLKPINTNSFDLSKVTWSILAIQYDKLGLAQKGLSPAHILNYRNISKIIDCVLKSLIENKFAIGNEVYRDETGIYFLVSENLKGEKVGNFYQLHNDLNDIRQNILKVFSKITKDEFYPTIILSESSRATMNLTTLIYKAKENFLKADYSLKKELNIPIKAKGICQVCQFRLSIYNSDNVPMCKICIDRKKGRVDKWLQNQSSETIWIDELADTNNKVALVSLKFELKEWLNGKLFSSLLGQKLDLDTIQYNQYVDDIFNTLKDNKQLDETQYINNYSENINPKEQPLRKIVESWFIERVIGTIYENSIKEQLTNNIDFSNRKIQWNNLNDDNFKFLSKLLLQFLLRKNPSPARLRRVWKSTEDFFGDVQKDILSSFIDTRTKKSFKQKVPDFSNLDITDNQEYKQYFSIIDPTPISWQFIIPTAKVESFIGEVQKLYYHNFKYVNGKLPLHIGVVVQKSKDPLYVGIKALRNMRRDIKEWSEIKKEDIGLLKNYTDEVDNNPLDYYYLYETQNFDYDFMLLPSSKGVKKYNSNDSFIIYPNTIDFEYLDTNTRRNDIYYKNGKRVIELKQNRPYSWEEFKKFEEFKKQFKDKSNQLQSLVSLIYSKMEDWQSDEESFKIFMETTFSQRDLKREDFGMSDFSFDEVKKFLDMFEFWHTTLKEI